MGLDTYASEKSAAVWAQEEFGQANLGDARRTKRLISMAASAAQFPSGKLTEVFQQSADRQGAYKFVENEEVHSEAIAEAMGRTRAKRCKNESFVYVVVDGSSDVRETSKVPENEDPIEWLLYTNYPKKTLEDALLVVHGYMNRWHIEDYHRCWKSGVCNIESTQLQTTKTVKNWGTIMASIAARAERIKHLAREKPTLPAIEEFSATEIEAVTLLKRKRKKKHEIIPDEPPTIATVVLWIAEIGGYAGKSSGGPPGSTTIARGLERLQLAAELLRIQRE